MYLDFALGFKMSEIGGLSYGISFPSAAKMHSVGKEEPISYGEFAICGMCDMGNVRNAFAF